MASALVVADAFIIVPHPEFLVFAPRCEMLALFRYGQCVDLAGVRAVKHADGLAVEAVPVGDFAVRACGQELGLVGMVDHLFEHGRLEETHDTGVRLQVPDYARAVVTGTDCLRVAPVDLDIGNSAPVFLE